MWHHSFVLLQYVQDRSRFRILTPPNLNPSFMRLPHFSSFLRRCFLCTSLSFPPSLLFPFFRLSLPCSSSLPPSPLSHSIALTYFLPSTAIGRSNATATNNSLNAQEHRMKDDAWTAISVVLHLSTFSSWSERELMREMGRSCLVRVSRCCVGRG